ncbi:type II toxin-antitoxin system RelE/ParE family toxin [Paraburkholderia sp. JHI869]|uniref:type II toxin-antitoxin system RelE/ParE family toxin n=1 Tax=Paraburkholderia sp. JHI869 TaxID=3112959 RepID=UPI0031804C33
MIKYVVEFAEEFDERLEIITDYMSFHGRSELSIERYIDEVYAACDAFGTFPNRGVPHDDVMRGLRITHYQGDTILAYVVDEASQVVSFLGVFYAGQDWQSVYKQSTDH